MEVGYIDAYDADKSRQQVIVVLREDWTVACYDHNLALLWERGLSHRKAHDLDNIMSKYDIAEASLLVSSLHLGEESTGTVFVGIRVRLNDETATNVLVEGVDGMHASGDAEHEDMRIRGELEHFTVHALDGHTGKIMWMHDGSEGRAEELKKALPQHLLKMEGIDLNKQLHHTAGGNDWTVFRSSLISELPHDWTGIGDSSFRLAHFVRKHLGAGVGTQKSLSKVKQLKKKVDKKDLGKSQKQSGKLISGAGRFLGVEVDPLPVSAALPHDASEHTDHPNVLVAHTRYGVEIFALKGGSSITSLSLPEGRASADIDGDGIVDTIYILENDDDVANHGSKFAHIEKKLQRCSLLVVSGIPPKAQLFNGSLCSGRRNIQDAVMESNGNERKFPAVSATSPLVTREYDPATMSEAKYKSVCVAVSVGTVSCYSGKTGEVHWRTSKNPQWHIGFASASLLHFIPDAGISSAIGSHDSTESLLLVTGDREVALLSRENGAILTSAPLPYAPIVRTVIGDFDNDGVNDIIIVSSDSILGYKLSVAASTRGLLVAFLVLLFLAAIVFVSNVRTEVIPDLRQGKKKVLSMVRSTDDWHID